MPDPTPAPAPAPAPAPTPAWHGLTDANDVAFVDNKGWKSVGDSLKAYRSAVTLIGRDPESLLPIPKAGDEAGWNQTWQKLGRPDSADKYNLKAGIPDGMNVDQDFMKNVGGIFHTAGLTADQAQRVAEGYNKLSIARQQQAEKDALANVTADKAALVKEWGGGYDRQMTMAAAAVRELNFSQDEVSALQEVLGYKGVMTKMAELGARLSDPNFVSGNSTDKFTGTMTPAEANAEITRLKMDTGFVASLQDRNHAAHKENKAKWSRLFEIANPG